MILFLLRWSRGSHLGLSYSNICINYFFNFGLLLEFSSLCMKCLKLFNRDELWGKKKLLNSKRFNFYARGDKLSPCGLQTFLSVSCLILPGLFYCAVILFACW